MKILNSLLINKKNHCKIRSNLSHHEIVTKSNTGRTSRRNKNKFSNNVMNKNTKIENSLSLC